ncbi:hypothetical protein QQ054_23375 [Oscillatoria amoena NRMC-F 0135]|nr:hypothetical protein [Oscillatoria amoena NRMC-F 0135]
MNEEEVAAIEKYISFRNAELEKLNNLIKEKRDHLPESEPKPITLRLNKLDYEPSSKTWKDYLKEENNLDTFLKNKNKKYKKIIYKIDIDSANGSHNDIINAALDFKSKKNGIALSRINEGAKTNVLYIGSCEKGIEKRLKEHLGFGAKSTYSMQLHHLIRESNLTVLSITINIYPFEDSIGATLLKNIEFALWYKYKPLLGKGELDLDAKKL